MRRVSVLRVFVLLAFVTAALAGAQAIAMPLDLAPGAGSCGFFEDYQDCFNSCCAECEDTFEEEYVASACCLGCEIDCAFYCLVT